MRLARQYDFATNPAPEAIFEAGTGGFQIWCTPEDHPKGWDGITMNAGDFSKPCEFVGSVHWKWDDEKITGIVLETDSYALSGKLHDGDRHKCHNRKEDIEWAKKKIRWLFTKAELSMPTVYVY